MLFLPNNVFSSFSHILFYQNLQEYDKAVEKILGFMESFPTHGVGDVSNKDVLDVWRNNDVKIQSKWPCMLYYADMFDLYLISKPQSFFLYCPAREISCGVPPNLHQLGIWFTLTKILYFSKKPAEYQAPLKRIFSLLGKNKF